MNENVFYLARIGVLCKNTLCATRRIKPLIWKGYHIFFFTSSGEINNLPTMKFCPPPQVVTALDFLTDTEISESRDMR